MEGAYYTWLGWLLLLLIKVIVRLEAQHVHQHLSNWVEEEEEGQTTVGIK